MGDAVVPTISPLTPLVKPVAVSPLPIRLLPPLVKALLPLTSLDVFPAMMVLLTSVVPEECLIPPPLVAELPLIVLLVTVNVPP